jgi:CRP-like cAMP-binding protein
MLCDLVVGARDELEVLLGSFDAHGFWSLICQADPDGLGSQGDEAPAVIPIATPLFDSLGPLELMRVAERTRVRRVRAGDVVIAEGSEGNALYAVGRGRFVVHCRPAVPAPVQLLDLPRAVEVSDRIYLAGLADGDFFGEFSFLMEQPRSATVEAVTDGLLVEMDRDAVAEIVRVDPHFTEPLLQFYKERVVELMMAKSSIFSLLALADRKALVAGAELEELLDGTVVVEEGGAASHLYFIKRGEVEVFRKDEDGISIFINKLVQGQFFGEIAALKQTARTVSVRAMGDVALLKIDGRAFRAIVAREPRLQAVFDAMIASRTAEVKDRVMEHQRLFVGV